MYRKTRPQLEAARPTSVADKLGLDGREEALGDGVIPAVAFNGSCWLRCRALRGSERYSALVYWPPRSEWCSSCELGLRRRRRHVQGCERQRRGRGWHRAPSRPPARENRSRITGEVAPSLRRSRHTRCPSPSAGWDGPLGNSRSKRVRRDLRGRIGGGRHAKRRRPRRAGQGSSWPARRGRLPTRIADARSSRSTRGLP
jgi:hypothetical protein